MISLAWLMRPVTPVQGQIISLLSPTNGPTAGNIGLTIFGNGFGNNPTVTLNSVNCQVTNVALGIIKCILPPGQGARLPLIVTANGVSSNPVFFSYDPPALNQVNPATFPTTGGTFITLQGTNFGLSPVVTLGGVLCTNVPGGVSSSQIVCLTPPGQGLGKLLQVSVGLQVTTNTVFASYLPPSISGINPSLASTAGGTPITISGQNFGTSASVTLNTANCTVSNVNHTSLVCVVPPGQGAGLSLVMTVSGQSSHSFPLSYGPPGIIQVNPALLPTAGGGLITLIGTNFGQSPTVSLGGINCPIRSGTVSYSQIICTNPPGQGLGNKLTVSVGGQSSASFDLNYAPPKILAVSPVDVDTAGGTVITLFGTNFGITPAVFLGSSSCGISSSTSSQIICSTPVGQGVGLGLVVSVGLQSSPAYPYSYRPPSLNSVNPNVLPTAGNARITLLGLNFGTTPTVTIGGQACDMSGSVVSSTQIICNSPPGQGTAQLVLVNVLGRDSTNSLPVNYAPPAIFSVTPATADPSGGTLITLTGTNFGISSSVLLGTKVCDVRQQNHTNIICQVPAGLGVNLPLVVNVAGQTNGLFTYSYGAPIISSVTPLLLPTAGGTNITIIGTNFGNVATVTLDGVNCPIPQGGATSNSIIFPSPVGQGMGKPLVVTVGTQSSVPFPVSFLPPTITSVTPASGDTAGGSVITIMGRNFGTAPSVMLGDQPCSVTNSSHTNLVCLIPAGQGANLNLVVIADTQTSNPFPFSYSPPGLQSVSPSTLPTAGGTLITIFGKNFGQTPQVLIGALSCQPIAGGVSPTQLVVLSPEGQGLGQLLSVIVGTQSSTNTLSVDFFPPGITFVAPAVAKTAGGTLITITGTNFGKSGRVFLGANICVLQSINHTNIVCTVPEGQGAGLPLVVNISDQTNQPYFYSYAGPVIASVTPASADTAGGTLITIRGTNFGTSATVKLAGSDCPVKSVNHSNILCTVPMGQGLGLPLTVTVSGQTSSPFLFDYGAPFIASVTPTNIPTIGGTPITLTGTNFGQAPIVTLGGSTCTLVAGSLSSNQVVVLSPPGQGTGKSLQLFVASLPSNVMSVNYQPPSIFSVTPSSFDAAGGTLITIVGSNFGLSPRVAIDSGDCPVISSNHTNIVCAASPGQGTNKSLAVIVDNQVANFRVAYDPPLLLTVQPKLIPTAGGALITINGSSFGLYPAVTIGGIPCTLATNGLSSNSIVVVSPIGQGTRKSVLVTVGNQTSNPLILDYQPPTITSISPASFDTAGGNIITIVGSNFGVSPRVAIDSGDCRLISSSHTNIVCESIPGEGTNAVLAVIVENQTANFPISYNPPFLLTVQPKFIPTAGGAVITITGNNFGRDPLVTIGGMNCVIPTGGVSSNQIICLSPVGQGIQQALTVRVAGQKSNPPLTLDYYPPGITSVSPATADTAGGTLITLFGTNFGTVATVQLGTNVCALQSVSHTAILCTVPPGQGVGLSLVVTVSQQTNQPFYFSYGSPVITSVTPSVLPTAGGALITVSGKNFGQTPRVTLDGAVCTIATNGFASNSIVFISPVGQGTAKKLAVVVDSQTSAPYLMNYRPPSVAAVTPFSAPTSGRTTVTILGADFGINPVVTLGGTVCNLSSTAHDKIVFLTPPGGGGNQPLVVTAGDQSGVPFPFGYYPLMLGVLPGLDGASLQLFWPLGAVEYRLEQSPLPAFGSEWIPVTNTLVTNALTVSVGLNTSSNALYFRLQR